MLLQVAVPARLMPCFGVPRGSVAGRAVADDSQEIRYPKAAISREQLMEAALSGPAPASKAFQRLVEEPTRVSGFSASSTSKQLCLCSTLYDMP